MKIVVNNIAASSGGALSVLESFYSYIKNNLTNQGIEWVFLLSDTFIEETVNIEIKLLPNVKKKWINRLKFDFIDGKKIIEDLSADIVISMQNTIIKGLRIPQILYVHQSIPFQKKKRFSFLKKSERKLAVYQHIIGRIISDSIRSSDYTIVQTQWMKRSILEKCNVSNDKIVVLFPELNDISTIQCEYEHNKEFFYPANNMIYKNHNLIYSAIRELNNRHCLDFNVYVTIEEDQFTSSNIHYLGKLIRNDVIRMYSETILIFPSYIETIGLPLIEASLSGSIIFVADCEYSREVLEGYENAYFFNPFKYEELADLMQSAINKKIKRIKSIDYASFVLNNNEGWNKLTRIIHNLYSNEIKT